MSNSIGEKKQSLRRDLLRRRKAYIKMPDALYGTDKIESAAVQFLEFCRNKHGKRELTVFCYVSAGWEVPTLRILDAMFCSGISVCVPRCKANGEMDAVKIASFADLKKGMYDLLEPDTSAEAVLPEQIDVCFVPGLAFDKCGFRLGRGGGYYDRFLCRIRPDCVTVGLMFSDFILETVPTDQYDRAVNHILTEHGILF